MPFALKLKTITRPAFQQTRFISQSPRMSTNEYGQGKSHAQGDSAVPKAVQDAAPKGLEEALPDKVWSHLPLPSHHIRPRHVLMEYFLDPPHWRRSKPIDVQDARQERRRGLDCAEEGAGDFARERGARGAECDT